MPFEIFVQANETSVSLLEQALLVLQRAGFFQVIVPFILFFSVVFAILEKSKILGEDKKSVNSIVAFVIALTTTGAATVTGIISTMIPLVVLAIMILLLFFLVYGLVAGDLSNLGPGFKVSLGIGAGLAIALIFLFAANLLPALTGEVLLMAVIIAVISIIVSSKASG